MLSTLQKAQKVVISNIHILGYKGYIRYHCTNTDKNRNNQTVVVVQVMVSPTPLQLDIIGKTQAKKIKY
jgi:hypothetical protein